MATNVKKVRVKRRESAKISKKARRIYSPPLTIRWLH